MNICKTRSKQQINWECLCPDAHTQMLIHTTNGQPENIMPPAPSTGRDGYHRGIARLHRVTDNVETAALTRCRPSSWMT